MNKVFLSATVFLFGLPLKAQYSQKEIFPPLHQAVLKNDIDKAKQSFKKQLLILKKSPF